MAEELSLEELRAKGAKAEDELTLEELQQRGASQTPGRDPHTKYLNPESDNVVETPQAEPDSMATRLLNYGHGFLKGGPDEVVGHIDAMASKLDGFAQRIGLQDPPPQQGYSPVPPVVTHKQRFVDPSPKVQARRVPGTGGSGAPVESGIRITPQVQLQPDEPVEADYWDTYKNGRDSVRGVMKDTTKAAPEVAGKYDFLGDLTSEMIVAGLTNGTSLTPVGQTAMGGVSGFLRSDADLTKPNATPQGNLLNNRDRAALDTTGNAALGFAGGLAGRKFTQLADFLGGKAKTAAADAAEKIAMGGMKQLRSAVSAVGGESSAARTIIEGLKEMMNSPHATPEQKADATAKLASPEAAELLRGVFDNYLKRFGGTMGKLNAAGELVKQAESKLAPEALDAATNEALKRPFKPWTDRALNYASRTVPTVAGAWVGNQFGDKDSPAGTMAGAAVGGTIGAVMGNPGTALKNAMNNPAWRRFAWSTAESAIKLGGATLGKYGPVLAREYLRNPDNALAMHEALLLEDPEYGVQFLDKPDGGTP